MLFYEVWIICTYMFDETFNLRIYRKAFIIKYEILANIIA